MAMYHNITPVFLVVLLILDNQLHAKLWVKVNDIDF